MIAWLRFHGDGDGICPHDPSPRALAVRVFENGLGAAHHHANSVPPDRAVVSLVFVSMCMAKWRRNGPLLLTANHSSWTDIVILGSLREMAFIAKAEVATWPLFGMLAKLQRTVFIEREKRGKTHHQASVIATRLAAGDAMVLFAEGTTSDGNRVLPFKTSLFGAAQVAIRETDVRDGDRTAGGDRIYPGSRHTDGARCIGRLLPGRVMCRSAPSLIGLLKDGAVDVDVWFGEPVVIDEKSDRKALARTMEERVRAMVRSSLMGRDLVNPRAESDDEPILNGAKNL